MKVGDLVRNVDTLGEDYDGLLGMIVEYESPSFMPAGVWVLYFEHPENWKWYTMGDPQLEVVNEDR